MMRIGLLDLIAVIINSISLLDLVNKGQSAALLVYKEDIRRHEN